MDHPSGSAGFYQLADPEGFFRPETQTEGRKKSISGNKQAPGAIEAGFSLGYNGQKR